MGCRSSDYLAYLRSTTWQDMRALVFAHYGARCDRCGARERLQVHHQTYKMLGRESVHDLIVLCDDCHRRVHR